MAPGCAWLCLAVPGCASGSWLHFSLYLSHPFYIVYRAPTHSAGPFQGGSFWLLDLESHVPLHHIPGLYIESWEEKKNGCAYAKYVQIKGLFGCLQADISSSQHLLARGQGSEAQMS